METPWGSTRGSPRGGPRYTAYRANAVAVYREAGITWARMSRNYMVSEKWSSWEVVVFPSDHF